MTGEGEHGFSLVETLVALAVFTAVAVALQEASSAGIRGVRSLRGETAALDVARTKLAEAGITWPIVEDADEQGWIDRNQWHLTVRKYVPPESAPVPPQMSAYWVSVTVAWQNQPGHVQSVELKTIKLKSQP